MNTDRLINNHAQTIFLLGEMCAGKDYLGKILCEELGYTRIALADALKHEVAAIHGLTIDDINRNKAVWRPELQTHGEMRRKQNIDYWVDQFWIARNLINGPVVCTDARYINEATSAVIWHDKTCVVRILVPKAIRHARAVAAYGEVPESIYNHPSEYQQVLCPFNVVLNGTLPREQLHGAFLSSIEDWVSMGKPIFRQDLVLESIQQDK